MIREMKDSYPHIGLVSFCRSLGVTRQAYYQHYWNKEAVSIEHELVLKAVAEIRAEHRSMGCRKLLGQLQPMLLEHQIKMGRDALFDLLAAHKLLIRKKRRKISTTQSSHPFRKYPNLIMGFEPDIPNQLWVSDITYFKTQAGYVYISLITDAYSRKIVGYHVADNLRSVETLQALKMAIKQEKPAPESLIHHSDRGFQYCSNEYVRLLNKRKALISMTEDGDPLDNAIAERINGILKEEYLRHYSINSLSEAKQALERTVNLYNNQRPHMSLGMNTPQLIHGNQKVIFNKLWKTRYAENENVNTLQD